MYQAVQIVTGGQGEAWCTEFLPPHIEAGRVEVVAAVDMDPNQHENAIEGLGVHPQECYTDAGTAFDEHPKADFCTVVVPPRHHEEIVNLAVEHGLHVLSEKPIADTLEAAVRIAETVSDTWSAGEGDTTEGSGVKMGVTMSHRFDRDKVGLRRAIRDEASGPLDYLVGRFTCNARAPGSWGAFRHEMDDVLLIEGAVHQLDFLADMANAQCETIYADTWKPDWGVRGRCAGARAAALRERSTS